MFLLRQTLLRVVWIFLVLHMFTIMTFHKTQKVMYTVLGGQVVLENLVSPLHLLHQMKWVIFKSLKV